jgi:hypothetical protein
MSLDTRLPSIAGLDSLVPVNLLPLIEIAVSVSVQWDDFDYGIQGYKSGSWDLIGPDDLESQVDLDELLQKHSEADKVLVASSDREMLCARSGCDDYLAILIFRRADGIYVYFNTWCDSTGYGCKDDTLIAYSNSFDTFWNKCLDNTGRLMLYTHLIKK